ncbi:hypothetical protein Rsub_02747 [Raphidocelis subcapitata]|uniref:Uncharacterized protein n=1 Tax=Raphidocelis subcapitata TaxID=307507 RepID=A0A2V0NRT9_9CHLO|nr:hypothetical protein Rsub_02747 [Raphidocelis subcapitata]|eukprot:GBF90039.1 hypothetical protein Rsub_02747 [Raphidocelis subcapitata]
MPPDGTPRLRRARPTSLLLIAACCAAVLAALSQAAADCQAASNYQFSYYSGTKSQACFRLSLAGNCSSDEPCCLKSKANIKKLLLVPNGANPACVSRRNLKLLKVAVDAAQIRSRPLKSNGQRVVNTGVRGSFSLDPLVCIDASAVPGCGTIKELCGDACSFRLTARGPSRGSGKRATCCVNAAASIGKFNLVTINVGTNTSLDAYFEAARVRWEKIMAVDLPDVDPNVYRGSGFEWWPGYSMTIDDVTIFYQLTKIDGKRNVLGRAGPRHLRNDYSETPITGLMEFDIDDLATLTPDQWRAVILHEMGHVLGIGIDYYWQYKHRCIPRCRPGSNADVFYTCANAAREFAALPGCGPNLPVETKAGVGSGCAHWQETTLNRELMTPYIEVTSLAMPISSVTIGALEDIYGPGSVDYTQADPWNCYAAISAGPEAPAMLEEGQVILLDPIPANAGSGGREGRRLRAADAAAASLGGGRGAEGTEEEQPGPARGAHGG